MCVCVGGVSKRLSQSKYSTARATLHHTATATVNGRVLFYKATESDCDDRIGLLSLVVCRVFMYSVCECMQYGMYDCWMYVCMYIQDRTEDRTKRMVRGGSE